MSGPIGHTFLYNIIIVFIVIAFAFLSGTLSYYKAFKVNNKIIYSIEKFEGYNRLSKAEIERNLGTLGYKVREPNFSCPDPDGYKGMTLITVTGETEQYQYCIYLQSDPIRHNEYYNIGVLTYMNLDLPVVNRINIPVFTRTNQIYKFTVPNQ